MATEYCNAAKNWQSICPDIADNELARLLSLCDVGIEEIISNVRYWHLFDLNGILREEEIIKTIIDNHNLYDYLDLKIDDIFEDKKTVSEFADEFVPDMAGMVKKIIKNGFLRFDLMPTNIILSRIRLEMWGDDNALFTFVCGMDEICINEFYEKLNPIPPKTINKLVDLMEMILSPSQLEVALFCLNTSDVGYIYSQAEEELLRCARKNLIRNGIGFEFNDETYSFEMI
ncbi:hypothetical protein IKG41_02670 [Candidatus Saccharibacteria bacterium]|nr:hypothetical protein [Candidatus Saccharibacteria bacterium]